MGEPTHYTILMSHLARAQEHDRQREVDITTHTQRHLEERDAQRAHEAAVRRATANRDAAGD